MTTLLHLSMQCGRLAMTTLRKRGQLLVYYIFNLDYMNLPAGQRKFIIVLVQLLVKHCFSWAIVNLG
jgi:hypothetical protein